MDISTTSEGDGIVGIVAVGLGDGGVQLGPITGAHRDGRLGMGGLSHPTQRDAQAEQQAQPQRQASPERKMEGMLSMHDESFLNQADWNTLQG
jgi:hypothetical protein